MSIQLPYPEIFQYSESTNPKDFTILSGKVCNTPNNQLLENDKVLVESINNTFSSGLDSGSDGQILIIDTTGDGNRIVARDQILQRHIASNQQELEEFQSDTSLGEILDIENNIVYIYNNQWVNSENISDKYDPKTMFFDPLTRKLFWYDGTSFIELTRGRDLDTEIDNKIDNLNSELTTLINNAQTKADNAIPKVGSRGTLKGYNSLAVQNVSNGGTVTINRDSSDDTYLTSNGTIRINFSASNTSNLVCNKVVTIKANRASTLTVSGGTWVTQGSAPTWGNAGAILILVARIQNNSCFVSIYHNSQG